MLSTYKIKITGVVQGVGFRPHVYRYAESHNIKGCVFNNNEGVVIYAQTKQDIFNDFLRSIKEKAPVLSRIDTITFEIVNSETYSAFTIANSETASETTLAIPPDAFVCQDCLQEVFDPSDRRYLYPFINCVNCGPRYSIITGIPYDRPNTTMNEFQMCVECKHEYENPLDRRFHAQPIACHKCGPTINLYNNKNEIVLQDNIKLNIVNLLKDGNILAVKGIGGYHLMADPYNSESLARLRERKKRDQKPFALIFETIENCRFFCDLSIHEEQMLQSVERPIVLVKKSQNLKLSDLVAPNNNYLGVMLAYTPLQHLILRGNFECLVCTSANISDEPIIYEDDLNAFSEVADYIVVHDRKIHTFVDDSVVRSIKGLFGDEPQIIRRARGYTPKTLMRTNKDFQMLAVGAELKNTVCIVKNETILLSQHIGDLKKLETYNSFLNVISHIKRLCNFEPELVACDLHPNFLNSTYANKLKIPIVAVQHHYAHMCACMIENNFHGDAIGVMFDGMGYGTDGNIWGGEFFVGNYKQFTRSGHFEYFPLPGGDICSKKISIAAFSCLLKVFGNKEAVMENWKSNLTESEMNLYQKMISAKINSPLTSSVGRIFDVVSAILGLCADVSYEGQAAILLEQSFNNKQFNMDDCYKFSIYKKDGKNLISLDETYLAILHDKNSNVRLEIISWRFHNTIVRIIYEACLLISNSTQIKTVVLSGGCFQNKFLLESSIKVLSSKGITVLYHNNYPTNDGGVALGQAAHVIYGKRVG